jgi:hypothetical protein
MSHEVAATPGDRPVRIVFGFPDGMLANPWFRAYKRVKRGMRRAAYHATVELEPLARLSQGVDVLIVERSSTMPAGAPAAATELVVAKPDEVQAEVDRLLARLVEDGRLRHAPGQARSLAIHLGFRAVNERARLAE